MFVGDLVSIFFRESPFRLSSFQSGMGSGSSYEGILILIRLVLRPLVRPSVGLNGRWYAWFASELMNAHDLIISDSVLEIEPAHGCSSFKTLQ
jgi:hypothetical protein